MARTATGVALVLLFSVLIAGCGGDGGSVDAGAIVAATTRAAGVVEDANAQYALSVSVPQYVDDIRSGTKPGGREAATDKLIAVLREHREALGDERYARTLRESAAAVRTYCGPCADRLEAEAAAG